MPAKEYMTKFAKVLGLRPVYRQADGKWPKRPTNDPDQPVAWIGADPPPPVVLKGRDGMLDGADWHMVPDPAKRRRWFSK